MVMMGSDRGQWGSVRGLVNRQRGRACGIGRLRARGGRCRRLTDGACRNEIAIRQGRTLALIFWGKWVGGSIGLT